MQPSSVNNNNNFNNNNNNSSNNNNNNNNNNLRLITRIFHVNMIKCALHMMKCKKIYSIQYKIQYIIRD